MQSSGPRTSCRVVFFGNEQIATGTKTTAPILRALLAAGHEVLAVVLSDAGSRSRTKLTPAIVEIATSHHIPVIQPKKLRDIEAELTALQPDIGVLVAFGKLIPRSTIKLFPHGIVNIHPSLLPKHRGSTPIESVLLAGETETGVSLMQLVPEMDAGPVYAQSSLAIPDDMTKQTLADTLAELGAAMLLELLPGICSGEFVAIAQDHDAATYDVRIEKTAGVLSADKPALQLAREVKAYAGWPGSRLEIAGKDCTITSAHVSDNTLDNVDNKTIFIANKQLCLQTTEGILVIDSLKPAGKNDMPAQAFLAGHRQLL